MFSVIVHLDHKILIKETENNFNSSNGIVMVYRFILNETAFYNPKSPITSNITVIS